MSEVNAVEQEALDRWAKLELLQAEYAHFEPFLIDCMEDLMGFTCSDIQIDIGDYLEYGPQYLMIQAQRSQAKSTIVAIFAVWCLIHDPRFRVLILSAGSEVAMEIANWVIQIIMNWDILECMRPDRNKGDRASTKAFDVHWQLKGAEKSPSVACIGITANMQGRRADLLIPDDIESSKNGLTEVQRQHLLHLSKDFTSICQTGRIAYLGTPQTIDSIYNSLPGRGYQIRIWPGRYPTLDQMENYGEHLAPLIAERIAADPSLQTGGGPLGDQGKAVDPLLVPEEALVFKELDQGPAYFQLQHMLNTRLMDKDRYPLKTGDLINMPVNLEKGPGYVDWMPDEQRKLKFPGLPDKAQLYRPFSMSSELFDYEGKAMYVDPAGGGANGDETVAFVTYFLHGYVYAMEMLPLPGGYDEDTFVKLADLAFRHQVNEIQVEENFGHGAFAQMFRPVLLKYYEDKTGDRRAPAVEDVYETGQKELRIADTLEPIMARHRLIINEQVWHLDRESIQQYPIDKRENFSLLHQMQKLTREHHALIHDDRLETLAGACRPWVDRIAVDEQRRIEQKQTDEQQAFMNQWANHGATNKDRTAPMRSGVVRRGLGRAGVHRRRRRR